MSWWCMQEKVRLADTTWWFGASDRADPTESGHYGVMTRTGPREDIAEMGLHNGPPVDLVPQGATADGTAEERRVHDFRVVEYRTPRGNAAAYYSKTNPLAPLDHVAVKSNTSASKTVVVPLEPNGDR